MMDSRSESGFLLSKSERDMVSSREERNIVNGDIRHDDVMLRHVTVSYENKNCDFLVRVINKSTRKKKLQRSHSIQSSLFVDGMESLYDEIEIRENLHHHNVLSLYAVRDTQPFIILFEEWCDKGPCVKPNGEKLLNMPKFGDMRYSEDELARVFWDACQGLYYLHGRQICHLNLRPEYFIRTNTGDTKISGFTHISNIKSDLFGGLREHFTGDTLFQAPECWKEGLFSSYSADLWAMGVSLYFLAFGISPVPCTNLIELMTNIKSYSHLPNLDGVSAELKELVSLLLSPDVAQRPCLEDVLRCRWFSSHGYLFNDLVTDDQSSITMNHDIPCYPWTCDQYKDKKDIFDFISVLLYDSSDTRDGDKLNLESANSIATVDSQVSVDALMQPLLQRGSSLRCRPKSSSVNVELPKKGIVRFKSANCCYPFYRKCELYVEKGHVVITPCGKTTITTIHLETAFLVEHEENDYLFEIRTENGDFYIFKTVSEAERQWWEVSISYAIRLVK